MAVHCNFWRGLAAGLLVSVLSVADGANAVVTANVEGGSLDEVSVTGTRTPVRVDDSLSAVTVFTDETIERRQVQSLQELLTGAPGIQISNNGGLGKVSSVFLRGAEAGHVLVLVDGVRMGSSTLGTTAFQYLPMDEIDHVEVVRGPLSSLYGSEAIGGVIQLFTRRATTDGVSLRGDSSAGSHGTYSIGGGIEGLSRGLSFGVSLSNLTSDGYPNCTGAPYLSPAAPGGGCFVYDTARDGYHNASASAHIGWQLGESGDIEASFLRSQGGTRYAGSFTNHERFVEQAALVAAHWTPLEALRVTAQIGQSRDNELDTLDFVEPSSGNLFDTTRNSASLQIDWQVAANQILTLGSDYLRDTIASDVQPSFPITARNVTGIFGEYQGMFGAQHFAISVRNDHNTQFGEKTTGNAAWSLRLPADFKLSASAGTAFRAPSFDELYFPGFGTPTLKPESSTSYELGVEQRLPAVRWSTHLFQRNVRDLIGFDSNFLAANTDIVRIRGAELLSSASLGDWSGTLNIDWLDPRNRTPHSPNYDNLLNRRARHVETLELSRKLRALRGTVRFNVEGPRFEDLANSEALGGFSTFDVLFEWTLRHEWTLQAKIANTLDHRYQTALYYPEDGRNFLITLRYRPAAL